MKNKLLLIASLVAGCFIFNAQAKEATLPVISTKELVEVCKVGSAGETRSYCVGYMTATYDTYLATRHPKNARPFICVKQPAPPRNDVINDYIKWADAKPELANKAAAGTFLDYLATRFPCGK